MTDNLSKKPIHLDPKKFANLVVSSHDVSDDLSPEKIVKRKLTLYLTALMIAERFNQLENRDLRNLPKDDYHKLIGELEDETFEDW
ncbi:hypothetical protein FC83_GL002203 [Agrilactobacillus composti DSM 18527 = JCM 14202]|uniref:Uncharacterized protein n=1 Tax=Agrilactobacillus composti DSM 18527 = JCM 14202 TaxID=1423734 RepID=X0PUW0_9LACO|nr:hypothetical protein [Agrilactobacillus composti]KRM34213.1 hypothetical protein FC83_GL002203 [Agrilactobacillus composti DSM 18527 = JCM 14202]GAF41932.1 hypothetical protein JCM14202_3903 [Agrilactobacillus composti DSM 18527 = JCM 14202]